MQERLTPKQIKLQVAREFGIDPAEMDKPRMTRRLVDAKHEAIARIHEEHRELSLHQIARHFGLLDHSSVINALKRLKAGRYAGSEPRQRMKPRPILTEDLARDLYFNEGHSARRMSKDYGMREDAIREFFEAHEFRRGMHPAKPTGERPARALTRAPEHVVASTYHQIDFKRAGHSAEWYRANCEISELEDARERRRLAMHPRVIVRGHQHGSWMGSPASLCASAP